MNRPKSAAAKAKKSVGFSSHNQTIDAPEHAYPSGANFGVIAKKMEFRVQRVQESENFRQIPKYSHSPLAVIHPTASRDVRPVWKPPRNLGFDGSSVHVQAKRFDPKNIPEHLSRPAIDEEKLMTIRANEKSRTENAGKKMSLGAMKAGKVEQKRI